MDNSGHLQLVYAREYCELFIFGQSVSCAIAYVMVPWFCPVPVLRLPYNQPDYCLDAGKLKAGPALSPGDFHSPGGDAIDSSGSRNGLILCADWSAFASMSTGHAVA